MGVKTEKIVMGFLCGSAMFGMCIFIGVLIPPLLIISPIAFIVGAIMGMNYVDSEEYDEQMRS